MAKKDVSKWGIEDWDQWLTEFHQPLQSFMNNCEKTQCDKVLVDKLIEAWEAGATCHLKYQLDALEKPEKCITDAKKNLKLFLRNIKQKIKNK